ncbi:MAG: glycine cleavage T C-terminal barrel domain-containing protein [Gammaproteobacteria bacterium]
MRYRLTKQPLEWIDRQHKLRFSFEGKTFEAFEGDVISSALWANNVRMLGRSFKYHRPRGLLSLANHDVNVMLQSDNDTHIRGDVRAVQEGESYYATNTQGGLKQDRFKWLGKLSAMMPVGFYYKAFHSPRFLFPLWETIIRRAAGIGKINTDWKRRFTPKWYEHADVLVVGAGPSGIQAAQNAAEQGMKVILADENKHIGGSLDYQWVNDTDAAVIRQPLKQQVLDHPLITVKTETVVGGYYADNWIPLSGPEGIAKLRVKAVIVASGLLEQPAVFHNNDLPGVMLMSAAQRLVARYAIKPGNKAVVLVANEEGYRGVMDMYKVGIEIQAVVDLEPAEAHSEWVALLNEKGITVYSEYTVNEACGKDSLDAVVIGPIDQPGIDTTRIDCDLLLMSVGWSPAAHLLYQAGGKLGYDKTLNQFVPGTLPAGIYACGRVNGVFKLTEQLKDGERAAQQCAAFIRGDNASYDEGAFRDELSHSSGWPIVAHPDGKNFVDFDEDLQLDDLLNAAKEGFDNIELLKRFSTVGMGPSQGKHANMNAIRILAKTLGQDIDQTGSTTARPFYHPVRLDDLAGTRFRVHRVSAMHQQHIKHQAVFMDAGTWQRPEFYGDKARRETMIREEVQAVREGLGLIDVSTLGKIEVMGPDAACLLDTMYTMRMTNIKHGMTRYALMVDESGVIIDDGIVGKISDSHYYLTATTSHADITYRMLSRAIAEWGLDVRLSNRTGQQAAVNLAGPYSRELLAPLVDIDISDEAFPYLGIREANVQGIPARLMRVGFVGELGFEIHVPYNQGESLWQLLMEKGKQYGIRPFGVEAQRRLRMEKGHIIVGQDTDGLTTPYEAGMPWAVHLKKTFFVGRQTLAIMKDNTDRVLVGFQLAADGASTEVLESHLVIDNGEIRGRVTSVGYSPSCQRVIGMIMLDKQLADIGTPLCIRTTSGDMVKAEQVSMPFYDPDGLRQKPQLDKDAA